VRGIRGQRAFLHERRLDALEQSVDRARDRLQLRREVAGRDAA
jgi:hypothetical protein